MIPQRQSAYSLDLLSDAAHHLAADRYNSDVLAPSLEVTKQESILPEPSREISSYRSDLDEDATMKDTDPIMTHVDHFEDYNLFLDDSGLNTNFFSAFDTTIPVSFWSKPSMTEGIVQFDDSRLSNQENQDERISFSRFGSRLPSLQPEQREGSCIESAKNPEESGVNKLPWSVTPRDHGIMQSKLEDFSSVLPSGFSLPLRRTLARYLEGYISGFTEHMPCLHIPTLVPANLAPELLLAIAAIGAQYRFESYRGNRLWYAARAVALEQLRRRNSQQVMDIISPPSSNKAETPGQTPKSMRASENRTSIDVTAITGGGNSNSVIDTPQARLETIQALFLLMAMGTWGSRGLVREALVIRSQLALLVRDEGLMGGSTSQDLSWEAWAQLEGEKRTKFIVYYFFNLQCMAYDMPPLILSSEINLSLPCSAKEWKADNAAKWRELRQSGPPVDIYFHDALARMFTRPAEIKTAPPTSSLGNYILIGAIIQQIYFVRKTSIWSAPETVNESLTSEDIDRLSLTLRAWQISWERTPESSLEPNSNNGPIAFSSTALLRLAHIRLHVDLGPCRNLETRDPRRNAAAFRDFPPLKRSPHLIRAVLQSAHALSIPVKIGIAFVARTQTFSWSIQHSLCNLECAFLLSKWLDTIAASAADLTTEERTLLDMVRNMVNETELAVSFEPEDGEGPVDEGTKIKQLAAAVVRLWAETFKGTHIFEIVQVIGQSLDIYADMLETAIDMASD
ncbi:hypothetical protein D0Z07_2845 [Hyphodiscus hymeniophilus]|uniref:Xylanolytic transcriptional activator regulatory domain-containing protein n=1 Tax=Hyphodiscus hymeniophilus TaxID=353542 RepID=A0A9P6VMQ4_9HELO|nr:hypothetical protein D0Z07_2845 [Hyphodiscus hymeniophilus]